MKRLLKLTFVASGIVISSNNFAHARCEVHDHTCAFHGIGRSTSTFINNNPNFDTSTAAYVIGIGSNTNDFDNNVLLPDNVGPYIVSTTGFPTRSDQPYIGATEQVRHVYPSQYQVDFQTSTARAAHSGDLNGLEVVPASLATGCERFFQNDPRCEQIKVIGNLPDTGTLEGFELRQTNHLYNAQNNANPDIDVFAFAYATGRASIIEQSQLTPLIESPLGISVTGIQQARLSNTGDKSPEYVYNFRYNDFEPHAYGTSTFYNQTYKTSSPAYHATQGHKIFLMRDDITKTYNYSVGYGDMNPSTGQRSVNLDTSDVTRVQTVKRNLGLVDYTQEYKDHLAELHRQKLIAEKESTLAALPKEQVKPSICVQPTGCKPIQGKIDLSEIKHPNSNLTSDLKVGLTENLNLHYTDNGYVYFSPKEEAKISDFELTELILIGSSVKNVISDTIVEYAPNIEVSGSKCYAGICNRYTAVADVVEGDIALVGEVSASVDFSADAHIGLTTGMPNDGVVFRTEAGANYSNTGFSAYHENGVDENSSGVIISVPLSAPVLPAGFELETTLSTDMNITVKAGISSGVSAFSSGVQTTKTFNIY